MGLFACLEKLPLRIGYSRTCTIHWICRHTQYLPIYAFHLGLQRRKLVDTNLEL